MKVTEREMQRGREAGAVCRWRGAGEEESVRLSGLLCPAPGNLQPSQTPPPIHSASILSSRCSGHRDEAVTKTRRPSLHLNACPAKNCQFLPHPWLPQTPILPHFQPRTLRLAPTYTLSSPGTIIPPSVCPAPGGRKQGGRCWGVGRVQVGGWEASGSKEPGGHLWGSPGALQGRHLAESWREAQEVGLGLSRLTGCRTVRPGAGRASPEMPQVLEPPSQP